LTVQVPTGERNQKSPPPIDKKFVSGYKLDQGVFMSVPQDKLMELMRGPRSAGGGTPSGMNMPGVAETPAAMSDAETPPMASPMSTPEPKMGSKEGAMINLGIAQDLLEQSLPAIGSDTDEGRAILAAITAINKTLGPRKGKTNELQQSEILQMLQTLPQAGGATPEGKAMAQAPIPGMPPQGGAPTPPPM
jgi:hypothetical protein